MEQDTDHGGAAVQARRFVAHVYHVEDDFATQQGLENREEFSVVAGAAGVFALEAGNFEVDIWGGQVRRCCG